MKLIRAIVLGAIVVLSLLGGTTTTANATPGAGNDAAVGDEGSLSADPGDPGLPPDQ